VMRYQLKRLTHYIDMPKNYLKRIIKGIYLIAINFFKNPICILNSLNFFKYGNEALCLNVLYSTIPFLGKQFDIIHCHFGPVGILGTYLKEIGIPGKYVTSFHGYDVNSYTKIKGANAYKDLFLKGDLFTVNTNYTLKRVTDLGCSESKIRLLHVGIKSANFDFFPRQYQPGTPLKVLTVGRLVEKKGYEYSIRAIHKLIRAYDNLHYMIAGDGPLRKKIGSLVSELGLENHVFFLGAVEANEVADLYRQAHVFLLASITASDDDREGQALVLQEAQASGLPLVSTLHNGIPEGVLDGESGFLVPEGDADALAEKLDYLFRHPELWPEMGRKGRQFVEEHFENTKLNTQLIAIYEGALGKGFKNT